MQSASTFTMMTCLPLSIAVTAWYVPTSGLPVISRMTSISGWVSRASELSITAVPPVRRASSRPAAA